MAILKHISSKNANYGDAEKYLTFEHDEFTMKPTLDADGRLIPRVDYRISSLNCGGEDFAVACMRSNLRYGKNQKREDVKSHHYIIRSLEICTPSYQAPMITANTGKMMNTKDRMIGLRRLSSMKYTIKPPTEATSPR